MAAFRRHNTLRETPAIQTTHVVRFGSTSESFSRRRSWFSRFWLTGKGSPASRQNRETAWKIALGRK